VKDRKAILVVGAGDSTGGAIARRFAREGFVACVTRRTADKLEPLVLQIQAEGGEAHGFASDARKEVMLEPFVRGDDARNMDEAAGFGLGLSIARTIAIAHHGALSLNDRQPHGLIVRIQLPVRQQSRQSAA